MGPYDHYSGYAMFLHQYGGQGYVFDPDLRKTLESTTFLANGVRTYTHLRTAQIGMAIVGDSNLALEQYRNVQLYYLNAAGIKIWQRTNNYERYGGNIVHRGTGSDPFF
jgi:hypothetical protein